MKSISLLIVIMAFLSKASAADSFSQDSTRLDAWHGEWEGSLDIYNNQGLSQAIPMGIHHFTTESTGIYGWHIVYGEDKVEGTRAYYLNTINEREGHYQVDEKNTIYLDSYMIGNKMISTFDVKGSLITSIYTLMKDGKMRFEIIYANTKKPNESGNKMYEGENIPLVYSYKTGAYQKALLDRIE